MVPKHFQKKKVYRGINFSRARKKFQDISSENGFCEADLRGAVFEKLDIENIDFSNSLLQGTSFRGAKIKDCIFNNVQTGLTRTGNISLILVTVFASLLSSLNAAYAVGFLIEILSRNDFFGVVSIVALIAGVAFFFFAIVRFFDIGFGSLVIYLIFLLVVSSTFAANTKNDAQAVYANSALFWVFVSLACTLVQAQAAFLETEISSIYGNGNPVYQNLYRFLLVVFAILPGALYGTYLVDRSEITSMPLIGSATISFAGYALGVITNKRYSLRRFSSLYQLFYNIIRISVTSFRDVDFKNVSFRNSEISNSDFSDCKVNGTLDITGSDVDLLNKANLAGSDIELKEGSKVVKKDKEQRPPTKVQDERLEFLEYLSSLNHSLFESLVYVLPIKSGYLPSVSASQNVRAKELLEWAESQDGFGLAELRNAVERVVKGSRSD